MFRSLRPLAATAATLGAVSVGALALSADPPKPAEAAPPAVKKPEGTESHGKMITAVEPKPLGDAVKKGLVWLAERQNPDGGWSQGGGWRTGGQNGGRVEGKDVTDPSDVGNSCLALLAFIRAGHTPTTGDYKDVVTKGVRYVCERVEKADAKDLYVTDVRNTQLQSKIGPFVDTFLATLALSELKGKAGPDEARLAKALDKTIEKIAKNQKDDGTFAGNGGWAPVLSQGVANKALSRAKLNGAVVNEAVFARSARQSVTALNGTVAAAAEPTTAAGTVALGGRVAAPVGGPVAATAPAAGRPVSGTEVARLSAAPTPAAGKPMSVLGVEFGYIAGPMKSLDVASAPSPYAAFRSGYAGGGAGGDAGVKLYSLGQGAGNTFDAFNGAALDVEKARKVIADPKAEKKDKDTAEKTVRWYADLQKEAGKAQMQLGAQIRDPNFVAGFGSNGGEEFLSFLNVGEALVVKAGKDWADWDGKMQEMLPKAQDKDGSWSGHHCITGKTFCTAAALLVLMTDRTQFPEDVVKAARAAPKPEAEKKPEPEKKPEAKPEERK